MSTTVKPLATNTQPMKDMETARAQATFPVSSLTNVLYGGPDEVEKYRRLTKILSEDPLLKKDDRCVESLL